MDIIKKQIQESISSESGYFPSSEEIYKVQTDINVWPYNRFFRGEPQSSEPIIWEREAGFQEILPQKPIQSMLSFQKEPEITTCFQNPCSTTLPCQSNPTNFKENRKGCVYISP